MTVLTENDGFDPKRLETHFYPGRHVLTRIDSVDSVLTENDGFDPKIHFLLGRHGLTCIDPVESVLMERCG